MILIEHPWTRQPQYKVPVNGPLSAGIVCGTLGSVPQFINGISPIRTFTTTPPRPTPVGIGIVGTAVMQQIARPITTTSDITLLVVGQVFNSTNIQSTFAGLSHNGATATFTIASGNGTTAGAIAGQIYLGGYRTIGGSYVVPVGEPIVAVLRHRHNVDQTLWVNGHKDASGGTWTGATVGNQYWGHYSSINVHSPCALGIAWNRALSDAEIAQLSDNPWQIFEPQRIWVPVSVSAGGGSTYTFAVSGGVTFSGAAPQIRSRIVVPSGGVTFSGTASQLRTRLLSSNGGVTFSGSAPIVNDNTYIINPSGGVTFGGTAPELREKVLAPTGGVTFGGSARLTFLPVGGVTTNDMDRISVGVARKIGVS